MAVQTNPKRIGKLGRLRDFFINAQGGKDAMSKDPESAKLYEAAMNEAGPTLGETAKLGLGAASAHPFLTGAGALTTGMNIAGLTDDDKFGGQLGGAALGGLGSYMAGLEPGYAYLATTAGGALGSLFDKLRTKREQEAQYAQQMQSYYR